MDAANLFELVKTAKARDSKVPNRLQKIKHERDHTDRSANKEAPGPLT